MDVRMLLCVVALLAVTNPDGNVLVAFCCCVDGFWVGGPPGGGVGGAIVTVFLRKFLRGNRTGPCWLSQCRLRYEFRLGKIITYKRSTALCGTSVPSK